MPNSVPSYHLDRARCHKRDKSERRREKSKGRDQGGTERLAEDKGDSSSKAVQPLTTPVERPTPPDVLDHLVLGINETIKALERDIDDLKLRLMIMADTLSSKTGSGSSSKSNLLPTAPRYPSPPPAARPEAAPLGWIIIPLSSISPQSLASPIPQYCATYNSLVYQWTQLKKVAHTRIKRGQWDEILGEEREEVRVVPLGNVEADLAGHVGLRRLACLGVRVSPICSACSHH